MDRRLLGLLSSREKVVFAAGLPIERFGRRVGFQDVRKFRNLIAEAERLGFACSCQDDTLTLVSRDMRLWLRKRSSDLAVFEQVFIRNSYQPVLDYLLDNGIGVSTIVDAGSNIGLTAVKLATQFPDARIICLEPDPQNYRQLERNLSPYRPRVVTVPEALWYKEDSLFIDAGFRDGRDWARKVASEGAGVPVNAVSLPTLIRRYSLDGIDLLKVDIEGSEANVFKTNNDLSYLSGVKVVAVEIHDEFGCRQAIYGVLKARDFVLFNVGELTIGVNTRLAGTSTRRARVG